MSGIARTSPGKHPPPGSSTFWERLRAVMLRPELTALVSTVAVFAFFAINAGDQGFLTFTGTRNYLQVAADIGIIASPITLLLVAGEFDLSVGTMVGAAGIAVAYPIVHLGWPLWAALCSGLTLAAIVGIANGLLIVRLGIPSFLATLGMMFFLRGLTLAVTLLLTGTTQIYQLKDTLRGDFLLSAFAGTIHRLPVSIFWWVGVVLLCAYLLSHTRFGNWIYASGGDRDAAIKMGVPVEALKICLYVATAASAVLVAVVNMLFADMAEVSQGVGKEFEAIVAAVVGGAATTGGLGSPIGTAFGTLMFGMISQGFFYTNINDNWFYSFVGAVLVFAVVANKYAREVAMRQKRLP
jgi:simple sugar transport system permease protein